MASAVPLAGGLNPDNMEAMFKAAQARNMDDPDFQMTPEARAEARDTPSKPIITLQDARAGDGKVHQGVSRP